jgi:hypothetical protein
MKRTNWGIALTLSIAACTGSIDAKDLKPGLNLFAAGSDVSGAYVSGERAVFFETRRGEISMYATLDPEAPPYEMDVRVLDQNGRTLYVRLGGDGFIDPAWASDLRADLSRPPMDPAERAAALTLMQEAMTTLSNVALDARLAPEHTALVRAGTAIPEDMIKPSLQQNGEIGFAPPYNYYELHRKTIYAYSGEHSATYLNVYGTLIENCNHGECADSMATKCGGYGSAGWGYWEQSGSTGSVTGTCLTGYDLFSQNGGHNCHDDSVIQMRGMIWGGQDQYGGTCSNGTSHRYAPSCGTNDSW